MNMVFLKVVGGERLEKKDLLFFTINQNYFVDDRSLVHIECDRCTKEGVDDVGVVVELFVNHQGQNAHLCGTAIV